MKITVVGLGLIGASLAKSIKKNTAHTVYGIDKNASVIDRAAADGAIDAAADEARLADSDLTIVSLYPAAAIEFVRQNAAVFKKGSVVTDTCGIKRAVCTEMTAIAKANGFHFVGAHPMAGKEKFGYDHSEAGLFDNAYMILTPDGADASAVRLLEQLSRELHFKGVTVSSPEEHDRIIAYTSQIPHVLACAYISDPDAALHSGFSAGSYKDISRVADINAPLWQELFIENKDCLVKHIDILTENLQKIKNLIESDDHRGLTAVLQNAKETKNRIG